MSEIQHLADILVLLGATTTVLFPASGRDRGKRAT
jgi:hypothetical protein